MSSAPAIEFTHLEEAILLVTFHHPPSDEEFTAYLEHLSELYRRCQPMSVVIQTLHDSSVPLQQRRIQAQWIREHEKDLRRWSQGTAFVVTSAVVRLGLTSVLLLQRLPMPHVVVKTLDEALAWARSRPQLAAAGR